MADKVKAACERELWDGEWYLRGITAKGLKVGSQENEEGKVFIESNTWAVVSDAASPERGRAAMDAVDKYLYSEYGIHLLWPAFSKPNDDIGFVGRVYKGIKENAAIFSHPNPWAVIAECKLGRGEPGNEVLRLACCPTTRTTRSRCARRNRIRIASSSWAKTTRPTAERGILG